MSLTPHDLVIETKSQIREIGAQEALKLMSEGALTIDVREYDEYVAGHIPGAAHIPRGVLEFKSGNLPQAADKVICQT